jgi:dienelactone hydrolase
MKSDPARTAAIGHCMGGRLLIPFAADHPQLRAIVLYYPSVRDEPETPHRPRHAFKLAKILKCASLVFCGGKDYIATPAIQGPLWQSFIANGQPVEWHFWSDANHGFRHPDNDGFQPHYADLAWPLVTDFLQRRV